MGQASTPVMEFSSVLTSLDVAHASGRLKLEDDNAALTTAFLPDGVPFDITIRKSGDDQPIHIQRMMIGRKQGVFRRVEARGLHREFKFPAPGDYVVTYRAGGKPMTKVPIRLEVVSDGDEFEPKAHAYLSGPWEDWAYLFSSVAGKENADIQFRFWAHRKTFERGSDRYTAEFKLDGETIATSDSGVCGSNEWQFLKLNLQHLPAGEGRASNLRIWSQPMVTIRLACFKTTNRRRLSTARRERQSRLFIHDQPSPTSHGLNTSCLAFPGSRGVRVSIRQDTLS